MIHIFNLYIPRRTLILIVGEIVAICVSFLLAMLGSDMSTDTEAVAVWPYELLTITCTMS